jgi:hypothetical protein
MPRTTIQGDASATYAGILPFVPGESSATLRELVDQAGTQVPLSSVIGEVIPLVSPWSMSDVSKFRSPNPSRRHLEPLYRQRHEPN